MTQPVGSVFGTNPNCRTYLRSSPIICTADTVMFLVEVVVLKFSESANWRQAVTKVSETRFKSAPEGENQQIFRLQSYIRWLAFILGRGGSILKFAAAQGIPWSKAIALAYATSFCVFEMMIAVQSGEPQTRPRTASSSSRYILNALLSHRRARAFLAGGFSLGFAYGFLKMTLMFRSMGL